ncbi:DUF2514 family protein [Burkholderia sp. Ac-20384]|uniref:DUF2514 family protein n=1 Tax=Burkholderia sp. Ac-20384 TaxID=2703902 RepID=UPI001980E4D9|nr:DUF2514 family protein [Burkholderia sp. Ac-20384]MBN3822368.1 DUF2514 family protein [Burkholderia sp. Ac-20384]
MTLLKLVWPYVLAVLLGFAAGSYGEHLISAREIAGMKADAAATQAKAVNAARAEEQRRTAAQTEIAKDANQQRTAALADAFAARAAAGSLQQRVDQLVAAARHPAASAGSAPAGDPIGVLADVLGSIDDRAGELAKIADDRGIAGKQCERDYDSLTGPAR